jgi:formylglycine-generating enzyme required for sulfatase activity
MPLNVVRVLRGGAFDLNHRVVLCANRGRSLPGYRHWYFGFRVVMRP